MIKFRLLADVGFDGFAAHHALGGEQVEILTRASVISDEPAFYAFMKGITNLALVPNGISPHTVSSFLLLIHADETCEIYVDRELTIALNVAVKRPLKKGDGVMVDDIADIRGLQFPNITILPSDKIICCVKVGWKFGLYFDLARSTNELNLADTEIALGELYRRLSFEHVYKTLESEGLLKELLSDGWFPFIELIGSDYEKLSEAYKENFNQAETIQTIVASFTPDRIEKVTHRWWTNAAIAPNKVILEAGIKNYLEHSEAGYISCIKILGTEIEGILRRQHQADTGSTTSKIKKLIAHIVKRAQKKTRTDNSLFLPGHFLNYLETHVFANFDPSRVTSPSDIPLSRHSVSHGAAAPSAYTQVRALQLILILDQLNFYGL